MGFICREAENDLIGQREFLLELIPELEPQIAKSQLSKIIESKYPSEHVDELENLVGWRLFTFFSTRTAS